MKLFLIDMYIKDSIEDHEDHKDNQTLTKEEKQLSVQPGLLKRNDIPRFDLDEEVKVNIKKEDIIQPGFTCSNTKINNKRQWVCPTKLSRKLVLQKYLMRV